MKRLLNEQRGAAIILMALSVTALMVIGAIVVDVGNLYLNKARLANIADSAALAGVQDLPSSPSVAIQNAILYAKQNGKSDDTVEPKLEQDSYGNTTILSVLIKRNVPYYFAKIFNLTSQEVTASSRAKISAVSSASGIVPFGITKQNFIFGQTYTLKLGGGSGYDGNFGALALGSSGATQYRDNIKNGYNGLIKIGDWISTETGNMSGPTTEGVNSRISLDRGSTYLTVQKDSPRIIIVPIISSLADSGRTNVQVVGLAAFFLEGAGGQGNDNFVSGKFLQMTIPANTYNNKGYDSITEDPTAQYGLYGAALIP